MSLLKRKFTIEHRKKLSNAKLGKKRPHDVCIKISNSRKGLIPSQETREKMRLARVGYKHSKETLLKYRGKNNPNWRGGISSVNNLIRTSTEYKLWRVSVFKRDVYTCVWCGQVGGKLNADHIKPFSLFPELRFAIDNGRTLCVPCHKTTDTYAGRAKNKITIKKYNDIKNDETNNKKKSGRNQED